MLGRIILFGIIILIGLVIWRMFSIMLFGMFLASVFLAFYIGNKRLKA